MSRNTFAGGMYELLGAQCRDLLWEAEPEDFGAVYLQGVTPQCLNEVDLRAWLRNAPAQKPMYVDDVDASDGKIRGMPNLNLSEDQIDVLIAYLLERK